MKKLLALMLALAMAVSLVACSSSEPGTSAAGGNTGEEDPPQGGSTETISLRVWGAEEDQALLAELVEKFKAAYSDYNFDIQIGTESEATAKDTILTDIEAAADVFAFANDQLNDLVAAGALQALDSNMDSMLQSFTGKSLDDIKAANGEGSVISATVGDTLYAFPMGGGNNYFLLYDSSVLSEEDVATWDGLLAAAAAAGKQVGMTLASGWYNASFFYGAGFTTGLNEDGTTAIDWNGTSSLGYTGVDVVEAMLNIAGNSAFQAVPDNGLNPAIYSGALCAVVDGTWDASAAAETWGDGYTATVLPTFTIAGDQVQQGCVSSFKLMGVNAHSANTGWAVLLAEFLTNEESQTARFEARTLAPTNIAAASSEAVGANVAIAASSAQDAYGVIQTVSGKYWDPSAAFGEMIAQGTLKVGDTAGIQAALDSLVQGVSAPAD